MGVTRTPKHMLRVDFAFPFVRKRAVNAEYDLVSNSQHSDRRINFRPSKQVAGFGYLRPVFAGGAVFPSTCTCKAS